MGEQAENALQPRVNLTQAISDAHSRALNETKGTSESSRSIIRGWELTGIEPALRDEVRRVLAPNDRVTIDGHRWDINNLNTFVKECKVQ